MGGDYRWWSWLPERTGEIWSQPHCRACGPVSTNLLPLPVEVQNILDIHTGMGSSLQGSLWNGGGGKMREGLT